MARHRLTDDQWECIADCFVPPSKMGRPPVDRRNVLDGIFWILRTGAPWRDLPEEFGAFQTVWRLFNQWNADGTLDRIERRLRASFVETEAIDLKLWMVDGTSVRASKAAAGAGKKRIHSNRKIML